MQTIEQLALERVQKARAELILTRRFYGVLVSNVEPVISRKFPTAATNGKQHFWNPEFVMSLKKNHLGVEVAPQLLLLGVQAHESEHDARHHGTRRGSRDPVEWNVAGDYSINIDLIAEGFHLPYGALIDEKYKGLSSEDIYRIRELEQQKQQEQPKPEEPKDEDDDQPGENADTNPGNQPGDDADEGDDEGTDGEGDSQEAGDDGDGEGGEAGDDGQPGAGGQPGEDAGEGAGEPGEGGEGEGTGEGGDAPGEAGTGAGEPGEGEGKGEPQTSGDPGGCGEVLDADANTETDTDAVEEDARWDKIVRQAASMAKAAGQLPGHITREIERANNPPRDWRDELREFAEEGALRIETWNCPSRRHVGRGLVLPSTQKDGVNKAAFVIDTSGSCDHVALAAVNDEAQHLLDDGIVDQVVVIYGDTQVNRVDEYTTGDEIEFDPRGGGGTKLQPLFDYVAEEHDDASLIVCFTDLELYDGDLGGDEPQCPVLFAVHGYPQTVKRLIANAPWGARGLDVGVH